MSCERFSEAISDHACGAAIGDAAAAHLAACAACRRMFEEQRQLLSHADAELRDALTLTASPDFTARVSTRVRQLEPASSSWMLPTRWWIGAATAAVLALGLYLGGPTEPQRIDAGHEPSAALARNQRQETQAAVVAGAPDAQPSMQPAVRSKHPVPRSTKRSVRPGATKAPEQVVIVPPDQQRAIARLRDLLRTGQLDGAALPERATSGELVFEPLTIRELPLPEFPNAGGPDASGFEHRQ